MENISSFEDTCHVVNYRSIAAYARSLSDGNEAAVIKGMLSWMVSRHNLHNEELNKSIISIDEAHGRFKTDPAQIAQNVANDGSQTFGHLPGLGLPAHILTAPARTIKGISNGFVVSKLVEMGSMCSEPCHYACMMEVCHDHGLLLDRTQVVSFVRTLAALSIVPYKGDYDISQMANSMRHTLKKLPHRYREWNDSLKEYRDKCMALASCLGHTIPYADDCAKS